MTKKLSILLCALSFVCYSHAQTAAPSIDLSMPSDTIFPFNINLCTPDSTPIASQIALQADGKPTLLAFWLTTCYPCMMELDAYTKKYADWQKESPFHLIAISTDFPQRFQQIQKVVTEKQIPFPVLWDAERAFRGILPGGLNGLPQVFLYDKNGKLVWHHKRYYSGVEDEMFAIVKQLNALAGK